MTVKIVYDYIPAGMRHRPMKNPNSSLYGRTAKHEWLTYHEPWSTADGRTLHAYVKSTRAAERPASWHHTVDVVDIFQALPWGESGWHAGDNMGPGNLRSIGKEVCDYPLRRSPQNYDLFWSILENAARLDAYTIQNVDTLLPYPDCLRMYPDLMKQHNHWSGKNCPYYLRGMPDGWSKYVEMVGKHLKEKTYIVLEPGDQFWVIAGSYTVIDNALGVQSAMRALGFQAELRAVTINKQIFWRVVVGIYEHDQHKAALSLTAQLRSRGVNAMIVHELKKPVVIIPPADDEFPDEYDPEIDPDLDRDWIDEHEDQYDGGKDPYQDKLPTGLYAILLALYKWLQAFFGDA